MATSRPRSRTRPRPQPTGAVAIPSPWTERDPAMLGNTLTPARLTQILVARNQGYLRDWIDLADEAREKDPHLHSQLAIREDAVVETEFVLQPGRGSNGRAARRALTACEELVEHWQRPNGGWNRWLAEFVAGKYYGRSAHEVMWERVDGQTVPTDLELIDTRRLSYACDRDEPDPWALRIWDPDDVSSQFNGWFGARLDDSVYWHPDKVLVSEPRVRGAQKSREGLFSTIVWYWLFRTWSWRDVMSLTEMIGRTPVIGYFAAGGAKTQGAREQFSGTRNASKEEIKALKRAVEQVHGSLRAVLADTTRIEPLEFKVPGGDRPIQLAVSASIDALESKAVNGVDSMSDLKPGARAAVEVQERVSMTFWRSDCRMAADLMSEVLRRYVRANPARFGSDCPVPRVKAETEPPENRVSVLDAIERAQRVGMRVQRQWAHDATSIPAGGNQDGAAAQDEFLEPRSAGPAQTPDPTNASP